MTDQDPDIGPGNKVALQPLKRSWDSAIMLGALLLVVSALLVVNGFTPVSHPVNNQSIYSYPGGLPSGGCDPLNDPTCPSPTPCNPSTDPCPTPTPCDLSSGTCDSSSGQPTSDPNNTSPTP